MKKRHVLLRFDDICPTMNWKQWDKAKMMMDEAGVTALLGVVPDNVDPDIIIDDPRPDFWEYIKELQEQGFTIAMHGYHHKFEVVTDGIVTRNKRSEFAGLPYVTQFEKIREGKEILNCHGIETDVFFAPAHSYDDNTLKALYACGFSYVSDGYSSKPYIRHGIKLLPCRSGGVPRLRNKDSYVTAIVHAHEWAKLDNKVEFERFSNLLKNHSSEIVSFREFSYWVQGTPVYQRVIEKLYMYAMMYVAPWLIKLLRFVKQLQN